MSNCLVSTLTVSARYLTASPSVSTGMRMLLRRIAAPWFSSFPWSAHLRYVDRAFGQVRYPGLHVEQGKFRQILDFLVCEFSIRGDAVPLFYAPTATGRR